MTTDSVAPRARRRTWLYVLMGVVAAGVVFMIAAVTAGVVFFRTHVHTTTVGPAAARSEFERTLAAFADQQALLDARTGRLLAERPRGERRPIERLHVLAYDPNDEQLVDITVPGWLLRLAPHGQSSIKVDGIDVLESAPGRHITLEDLERRGPGLVLDRDGVRGAGRVVVWAE